MVVLQAFLFWRSLSPPTTSLWCWGRARSVTSVTLPSGDVWPMTVGDVLIGTAIVLVLIEFASLVREEPRL
jgi:hypothetical protein